MSKRPVWNVSVKNNGKITVYEFDGESEEYVIHRVKRSLEGEIVKIEMIEDDQMEWVKEGINYWVNPDCPRDYLEEVLVGLVAEVEGVSLEESHVQKLSDEELRKEVERYEYFADK